MYCKSLIAIRAANYCHRDDVRVRYNIIALGELKSVIGMMYCTVIFYRAYCVGGPMLEK